MSIDSTIWKRRPRTAAVAAGILSTLVVTLSPAWADDATPPAASPGQALSELSLDDLVKAKVETVYAASKHEQKTTDAPASVSVLSREDFQQFGYRTLADGLRSVRGFYVSSDRNYNFVGLRGVSRPGDYGGGTLLMIDGHRLNDPVVGQAFSGGEFPLDVDLIERVEIVRGPGSTLYGDNAFFSAIDVIPRRGRDVGLEASASAGSLDTYNGRVSLGHSFTNGVELLVSGTFHDSHGYESLYYPEFRSVNRGWADDLDGERRGSTFVSLAYGEVVVDGGYARRTKSMSTAGYETLFNIAPNELLDERAWADVKYRHESAGGWEFRTRVYFDHYLYDGFAPQDGAAAGSAEPVLYNHDTILTRWWGGEAQVSKTLLEKHAITLGVEGRHEAQADQRNYFVDSPVIVNDVRSRGFSIGTFAQDEYAVLPQLRLTGGVRYDYYSSFGDTVNPRAGLVWHPGDRTTLKLLYGHAYRAPNAFELDYEAVGYVGNHDLKPERIRSHELVWEQQFSAPLRLTTSLFYNRIGDQIAQVDESADPAVGGWIFRNLGDADVFGGDVELEGRWESGVRARLSYTYADARDATTNERMSNSPEHVATMNLAVPVYRRKVFAGLEGQWVGRRRSATTSDMTDGYGVVNFTVFSHELAKGLDVSAGVYNLLEHHYYDPAGPDFVQQFIQQDGRTFRVKLTYRY